MLQNHIFYAFNIVITMIKWLICVNDKKDLPFVRFTPFRK